MPGPNSTIEGQRSLVRRGSTFTDKQIARAVKDECAVQILLSDNTALTGWVYGMDDYHWGIVSSAGEIHLVHKSAPRVTVMSSLTVDSLPDPTSRKVIREVTVPFRDHVLREFFRQTSHP